MKDFNFNCYTARGRSFCVGITVLYSDGLGWEVTIGLVFWTLKFGTIRSKLNQLKMEQYLSY